MSLLDWLRAYLPHDPARPLSISLAGDSDGEARVRDELRRLLAAYDLRKWQFTSRVRVHERARIPHSHPVLTLNTRYDGELLLSTYLHEQLHWFVWRRRGTKAALRELRERYPHPPIARPEGAGSESASYLHYAVCYLEYAALMEVLGQDGAQRIIEHWSTHHYTEIYRTVLSDYAAIGEVLRRQDLLP